MLESYCRRVYQLVCVNPILPYLEFITPQQVTLLGCVIGVSSAIWMAFDLPWLAVLSIWLSGYFDTLDGSLARFRGISSSTGAAIDIVCDRVVEFAILLGLFSIDPSLRAWPCLIMLGSIMLCVTTFLVVGIFTTNQSVKSFHYSPGLIERAEAFLFFSLMILFPSIFLAASYFFSFLTILTASSRMRQFLLFQSKIS